MSRRITALLAAIVLAGACSESLSPITGQRYVLDSIGGESLPTNSMVGGDVLMVADTITITQSSVSTGTLEHRQTAQLTNPEPAVIHSNFSEEFTRTGNSLGFAQPPCPPGALCVIFIPHHALLDGDSLVMRYESDRVRPQRFRRIK